QKLDHQLARCLGALGAGLDLHAWRRRADAACCQHALALDLDHAGAAIAVRPVARLRRVAQMRNVGAEALRHLPDGLFLARGDLVSVKCERNNFGALPFAGDRINGSRVRNAWFADDDIFAASRSYAIVSVTDLRISVVSSVS